MKKILGFLFVIVILGCGGYFVYVNYIKSKVPKLNLEEEVSNASKYYVYGNHFNIEGNIDIVNSAEKADVIIINTCYVKLPTESKVINKIK